MTGTKTSIPDGHYPYDFLIVGAGFAGLVLAERLCNKYKKKCLVIDKRKHLGGNAYDSFDDHGILLHNYGPHYFRTNSKAVVDYLSEFTEWIPGNYRVKVFRDGRYWSFPINLETFEQFIGHESSSREMESWIESQKVHFDSIKNSEEAILSQVGKVWFEMFFEAYTMKQWRLHPRELDPSVCRRIPIRTERNDHYFNDRFQILPSKGYHFLFQNILRSTKSLLDLQLGMEYEQFRRENDTPCRHTVFTGPIDEYFEYRHGRLPYRSLHFERSHYNDAEIERHSGNLELGVLQPCVQVNYPGPEPYTRTVEAKHITGQKTSGTTIVTEFPADYGPGKEPYYPVPCSSSKKIARRYREEAKGLPNVSFIGRLGTYQYMNMDQVVAAALAHADRLATG